MKLNNLHIYYAYFKYLLRHKYYVLIECCKRSFIKPSPKLSPKLICGLCWRGITHDLSKFRRDEFVPYALYFYGPARTPEIIYNFQRAWLLHLHRNPHHHDYWYDHANKRFYPIPVIYTLEMICDWVSMNLLKKSPRSFIKPPPKLTPEQILKQKISSNQTSKQIESVAEWYENNNIYRKLHPQTREMVEKLINQN